eukprot:CAMPEP_0179489012 /NCGR_PEP_ID=MMETSP0799-20121207/64499_1 /TAXON_ID=46947 /ORGANISM="Geminigera cryophila, Strain CCMP2564" /LENGTH=81 /DNA_ID=CAMNT_0021304711 /DNA_START=251 /DNA_END=493 /DNA_ORIENTATION=+
MASCVADSKDNMERNMEHADAKRQRFVSHGTKSGVNVMPFHMPNSDGVSCEGEMDQSNLGRQTHTCESVNISVKALPLSPS